MSTRRLAFPCPQIVTRLLIEIGVLGALFRLVYLEQLLQTLGILLDNCRFSAGATDLAAGTHDASFRNAEKKMDGGEYDLWRPSEIFIE